MPQRSQLISEDENREDVMPNKKEGPVLLQNASIRRAVCFVMCPSRYACAALWAPTGYPPKKPTSKIPSVPAGVPHSFVSHRSPREIRLPCSVLTRIFESTKKGNREGITVLRHSCKPSLAPARAVRVSMIRKNMPAAAMDADRSCCFCFKLVHLRRIYALFGKFIPDSS